MINHKMSCQRGCPSDIQQRAATLLNSLGAGCTQGPTCNTIPQVDGPVCLPRPSPVPPVPRPIPMPKSDPIPLPHPTSQPTPELLGPEPKEIPKGGPGPVIIPEEVPPEGQGGGKGPVRDEPNPNNPETLMAEFIYPEDRLLAYLACIVYGPRPHVIAGFYIDEELTTDRVAVWKNNVTALLACKGTSLGTSTGPKDFIDDLALTIGIACNLTIVKEGTKAITRLQEKGYYQIQVCGHSLGGRGALCLAGSFSNVVRKCVVLNCGAPVVAQGSKGPGPRIARHYHIFGDLISTHEFSAENIRVQVGPVEYYKFSEVYKGFVTEDQALIIEEMGEEKYEKTYPRTIRVHWLNPWWHGTERFYRNQDPWRYAQPQEEQLSLEGYFLVEKHVDLTIISTALSSFGLQFIDVLKDAICGNPIPGAQQGVLCKTRDSIFKKILDLFWNAAGIAVGAITGFLVAGPGGAVLGGQIGLAITKGKLDELLNIAIPGWATITRAMRAFIEQTIKYLYKIQGDIIGDITEQANQFVNGMMEEVKTTFDPITLMDENFGQGIQQMTNQLDDVLQQMIKQNPELGDILFL